ncbi:MAG: tRNA (adenosine(37)-N6)-threonylcarbamoyltransferase complex dimerization subunit type 1 TsaB [Flavobacteriaceae bacterium]
MANILHIETSTEQCGVALAQNTTILGSREVLENGFTHAKQLHTLIDEVLSECGLLPDQLDAVAVSEGPGSFTGLRIGCVAAKGLCFALDIPLIALPTLQILATPHSKNSMVVSLLDARRDEVYAAVYNKGGTLKGETHAHILTASSFADLAANQVSFVGTGAEKTKDLLPSNPNWKFVSSHPSATAMPALAFKAFEKKQFANIHSFAPAYLKPVRITASKKDALGRPT